MTPSAAQLCESGRSVIGIEAEAVQALASRIDQDFVAACQYILACSGRVVVIGMG